jgi:beta-glucosidase
MKKQMRSGSILLFFIMITNFSFGQETVDQEKDIKALLKKMSVEEKIGQLALRNSWTYNYNLDENVKEGNVGAILNETNPERIAELQRIAVEESRLGIPLLFARDVIHGYKTIFPIPLAMACSFDPEMVENAAAISANEAASIGLNWTYSPMVDVCRDPRWGRIAEGFGEDTWLTSVMGAAMVRGYQGDDLSQPGSIAACVKHYAAYGAAEGGRDYNTVTVPENELRDIYLPPFKACTDAGSATIMTAFNEINGVPATGNEFLLKKILLGEWNYPGFVVSDWASVEQLVVHGYSENRKEAARASFEAGCHMEMATSCYDEELKNLLDEKRISIEMIDEAVLRILKIKSALGLFENPYKKTDPALVLNDDHKKLARESAIKSSVLLKNDKSSLPISESVKTIAVIGPLADAPHEQLGTWIFDGDRKDAITPLTSLKGWATENNVDLIYEKTLINSRDLSLDFSKAIDAAQKADMVLCFLGEESILSGESHSRADINLPGSQQELLKALNETGKPLAAIIMAGRPLTLEPVLDYCDAILYAWHGGTMAGPAIADLLTGKVSPSGKIAVSFPRHVGQIPIHYNHKPGGKPATEQSFVHMNDIPEAAAQLSVGNTSHYLDYGYKPLYPFGYGLSYSSFEYSKLKLKKTRLTNDQNLEIQFELKNTGTMDAEEIVQCYVQDLFGSRTRPVKDLKDFARVELKAGESKTLKMEIPLDRLAFHNLKMERVVETGTFKIFIGGDSDTEFSAEFEIIAKKQHEEK